MFTSAAEEDEGLWFVSKDAWTGREDVSNVIGGVPESLRSPEEAVEYIDGSPAALLGRQSEPEYSPGHLVSQATSCGRAGKEWTNESSGEKLSMPRWML